MNDKIKFGISAVSVCAITLALLVIIPSPTARINLVMSDPSFDNNTTVVEVRIDNSTYSQICSFTENNTTSDIDVGENVYRLQCKVYIHKDYAATSSAAQANTQVYMTIKDPSETVKYQGWLDNWAGGIEELGDVWAVTKRENLWEGGNESFLVTEGTWTITTKYEVYA